MKKCFLSLQAVTFLRRDDTAGWQSPLAWVGAGNWDLGAAPDYLVWMRLMWIEFGDPDRIQIEIRL